MKLRSAASFDLKRHPIYIKWALFLLLAFSACITYSAADQNVVQVRHAQFIISESLTVPPSSAGWQSITLPHRSRKPTDRDLVHYWYRAVFAVTNANEPLWFYFPKLRSGGAIFVNGILVEKIPSANASTQVRWFRPHLFFVPPLALKEGQNEITAHFAMREPLTSFGEFSIGPEQPLQDAFDQLFFWENTSTRIASAVCLVTGFLILVFWLRRRQERLYGMFGVCVFFWGVRTLVFRMAEVPMQYWTVWRFIYYLTTAGFITYISIFLLEFSNNRKPALNRLLILSWLGGSFAFLAIGPSIRPFMDAYWIASFLPFTVYAVIRLCIYAMRRRTPSGIAMVVTILFALALTLHDYAVQHGLFGLQEFYLLHLGIPAFLLVMGCVLLDRFISSLEKAESINEQLALRVSEREKELVVSYDQLRKLEREHAATEERQRIMQEMHDGMGSQLLSTLVMVQRGAATSMEIQALLQECIDEMRLAIDSLSPDDPDLLAALGNFRFRMESRFKGLGLTLKWRNHNMPDSLNIAPHAGLQLLRILQEALTNVLKHASAKKVEVDLAFSSHLLQIRISDDGNGFAAEEKPSGYGIANMQKRAKRIGASFNIISSTEGTAILLEVSLDRMIAPI
jgi:signal transduction histidine kinase